MKTDLYGLIVECLHNDSYLILIKYLMPSDQGELLAEVQTGFGDKNMAQIHQDLMKMEEIGLLYKKAGNRFAVSKFGELLFQEFAEMGNHARDSFGG
jgi:hypothetical protein